MMDAKVFPEAPGPVSVSSRIVGSRFGKDRSAARRGSVPRDEADGSIKPYLDSRLSRAAMFKLIRRFNYRSELRVNVLQVLVLFPGGYKSLKRAYPGVNDAIADHAKQETPNFQAAVMISVAVLA